MKKIILGLGIFAVSLALIPMFAAFEAHVINVTAKIENALSVPTDPITFGTVFPQEHLNKPLRVALSQSFIDENRVDDVEYFIRQKPKCGITTNNGTVLVGPTATGHVSLDAVDKLVIDCGPAPRELVTDNRDTPTVDETETWGVLPSLCPYISKDGSDEDGLVTQNDESLKSFHQPFTINGHQIVWNDTHGRLTKAGQDTVDNWIIDLAVPCFGGFCAQDWADFVHQISGSQDTDPNLYTQPIANEHKVFGCDLWVEVSGVSTSTRLL